MTFVVYLILYICSIGFSASAAHNSMKTGNNVWNQTSFYWLLAIFSFIIGTRYMVGDDYPTYMEIVQFGKSHFYYDHIEFIPRKFIDLVNYMDLEFYWWFILMALSQIFFLARAIRGELVKVFPWVIFCFLVLYLSFFMNVVRQGAALSCFLCAVTYAQERRLWPYLIFFLLGFWCHSSIIVWLPVYWVLNRELFPNVKMQYLLLVISAFILPSIIEKLIELTRSYWVLFGYGYQADNYEGDERNIILGSGLGMILRYVRWCIIIGYYNTLKKYYGTNYFILFYNLFFIGICFDYSSVYNILLSRVFMYGSFMEIIILSYLLYYLNKSHRELDSILFFILLAMLIALVLHPLILGNAEWRFVWYK